MFSEYLFLAEKCGSKCGEYFPIIFIIMLFYAVHSLGKSASKHVRFNINKDSCMLMLLFYAMIIVAILGA